MLFLWVNQACIFRLSAICINDDNDTTTKDVISYCCLYNLYTNDTYMVDQKRNSVHLQFWLPMKPSFLLHHLDNLSMIHSHTTLTIWFVTNLFFFSTYAHTHTFYIHTYTYTHTHIYIYSLYDILFFSLSLYLTSMHIILFTLYYMLYVHSYSIL